jgi:predicted MFS family arabinose efflux permease
MATQEFPRYQVAAAVGIAAISVTAPGLQPMLLGSLLSSGMIESHTLGQAATAEALGVVVSTAAIGTFLHPRRLRLVITLALLAVIIANIATITLPAIMIIPLRGFAGLGNGILIGAFLSMAARTQNPTPLYATLFLLNASAVFLLSLALGAFAIERFGPTSGYVILACLYSLLLLTVRFVPDEHVALTDGGLTTFPPLRGVLALFAVAMSLSGVMAFWVYAIPLGIQAEIVAESMHLIIAISTGIQILGSLAAIALATKLTGLQVVMITTFAGSMAVAVTMISTSVFAWAPALLTLAFCWTFGGPFHAAFLIAADPSRRGAVFVGTAQLFGVAVGPLIGSTVVTNLDYSAVPIVSLAFFILVLAIVAAIFGMRGRRLPCNAR